MLISVIIPTWRRPADLARCLDGVRAQDRPADEVIVVVRPEDGPTMQLLADRDDPIRVVEIEERGHVRALNRGLEAARGEVVAITDDDAVPRADWLRRIEEHFVSDPSAAGVGGRDWVHGPGGPDDGSRRTVGKLAWFGRVTGNHHLGAGAARDVQVLKGVNMSYRVEAIGSLRFDERLLGRQHFNDAGFSLRIHDRGWRLVYDPAVAVDHYPAPSAEDPRTGSLPPAELADSVHNETLTLLELLPAHRRPVYLLWASLVGTSAAPGLLQGVRSGLRGSGSGAAELGASLRGRLRGVRAWRAGRPRPVASPDTRPRVTIVANNVGGIGGMELQLAQLIEGLLQRDHRVTVVSWTCGLEPHPELRWVRVPGPQRPFTLGYPLFLALATLLARRPGRGAVVHANGAIYLGRADLTTVHFCHHSFVTKGVSRARRRTALYRLNSKVSGAISVLGERWCYRRGRTDRLVAVSPGVARELSEHLPDTSDRIQVIPNGVDMRRFAFDPDAGGRVRAELAIPADAKVAIFVGSDWNRKGLPIALEGVALTDDWHLLVVGEGDRQRFARSASALGASDRVHFLGRRADVPALYSAASALLFPTAYETFSMVAYEAAAVGLPLLAARVSGIEDILEHGVTGWFVERSPESVHERLDALAADPRRAARMGAAARQRVRPYDWSAIVGAYEDLYGELARGRAGRHLTSETITR